MMVQDRFLPGLGIYVCVDLRGKYALMTEHLLHDPEVSPVFHQMSCE